VRQRRQWIGRGEKGERFVDRPAAFAGNDVAAIVELQTASAQALAVCGKPARVRARRGPQLVDFIDDRRPQQTRRTRRRICGRPLRNPTTSARGAPETRAGLP
jgi:hypothetical protein